MSVETSTVPTGIDALLAPHDHASSDPVWRDGVRSGARSWLDTHPMPSTRDELWRYTPVDTLLKTLHDAQPPKNLVHLDAEQVTALAGDHGGPRLVFLNGVFDATTSQLASHGTTVQPLSQLQETPPLSTSERSRHDGFVALNEAAAQDGAAITIDGGSPADPPVHIVHVTVPLSDGVVATQPSAHVHLSANSQATVIESYVGLEGAALTNATTGIQLDEGASLQYRRIQNQPNDATHVGHVRVILAKDASLQATSVSLGAAVSRAAFDILLQGDGSSVELDGLTLPAGTQRHDQVVIIEHAGSHAQSEQRFRGVVDDRGRSSFTGQIIVNPGTVDTSAHQTNHNILLTAHAQADTRPWLEILADDVRCTHGATVGRLDDASMFYLQSRGIPEPEARRMLIGAFTREITDAIEPKSLRDHVEAQIDAAQTLSELNAPIFGAL